MCYGADALPPDHGIAGAVAEEQDLTLTSTDGTKFMAHVARAAEPNGNGVVVCPDVRGLHNYYCALTRSFARAGIDAVAFDYFGRTTTLDEPRDEATFDYREHIQQLDWNKVSEDVTASIAALMEGGRVQRVFTLGFCFGGAMSWRQAAAQSALDGAIGFYGVPGRVRDVVSAMESPLLLLLAGDDVATPREEFEKFEEELTGAHVPHRAVMYDGAPHSFFDRSYDQHREACADAWRQVFAFIESPPG